MGERPPNMLPLITCSVCAKICSINAHESFSGALGRRRLKVHDFQGAANEFSEYFWFGYA